MTRCPHRASNEPATLPAGPAPITKTSASIKSLRAGLTCDYQGVPPKNARTRGLDYHRETEGCQVISHFHWRPDLDTRAAVPSETNCKLLEPYRVRAPRARSVELANDQKTPGSQSLRAAGQPHPLFSARAVMKDIDQRQRLRVRQRILTCVLLMNLHRGKIHEQDARQYSLANPEALTLIDVLHYSSCAEQRVWLSRCAQALRPGGLLIIRELDTSRTRRPYSVRLEQLAVRFGWNRGAGVEVWSPVEMANDLTALGFTVVVQSAGAGVFRGNALVIARKPGAQRLDGR